MFGAVATIMGSRGDKLKDKNQTLTVAEQNGRKGLSFHWLCQAINPTLIQVQSPGPTVPLVTEDHQMTFSFSQCLRHYYFIGKSISNTATITLGI